jgi:hypothetical protein
LWHCRIGRLQFEFTILLISYYPFILSNLIYYLGVSVKPFGVRIAHNIDLVPASVPIKVYIALQSYWRSCRRCGQYCVSEHFLIGFKFNMTTLLLEACCKLCIMHNVWDLCLLLNRFNGIGRSQRGFYNFTYFVLQGDSYRTGTNCDLFTHK